MKTFFTLLLLFIGHSFAGHAQETNFVKGADVGFLQGQERRGVVFHDRNGRERECLELLKNDYQMSAIRMRVWVNPRHGDCDKNELLAMAKRVKAQGMDLMVSFHYSDTWADPKQQGIPAAWKGHSFKQMKREVGGIRRARAAAAKAQADKEKAEKEAAEKAAAGKGEEKK